MEVFTACNSVGIAYQLLQLLAVKQYIGHSLTALWSECNALTQVQQENGIYQR